MPKDFISDAEANTVAPDFIPDEPVAPDNTTNFTGSLLRGPLRLGQVAGAKIARKLGAPEERIRSALETPEKIPLGIFGTARIGGIAPKATEKDVLKGAALESALFFTPVGKIARGIGSVASAIGRIAPTGRIASAVGNIGAGATAGYGFDVAESLQSGTGGKPAPGIGTLVGAAVPGAFALGGAAKASAGASAPALINSLIKPLNKGFSYGKDPGRAVAQEGITANSLEELLPRITETKNAIGARLRTVGTQVRGQLGLKKSDLLSPFDDAITIATENNDQNLLTRLVQARNAITNVFVNKEGVIVPVGSRLLEKLDFGQGVALKRKIGDITKWTGNQTEDETVNGALTRTWGILKGALDDLATKNNPKLALEIRKLNERYGDLTSAEIATRYRDVLSKRQNLINLPGTLGIIGSVIAGVATGAPLIPILAGISSVVLDKILSSTAFKSRLAKALAKFTPDELNQLKRANPSIFEKLRLNFKFPGDALLEDTKTGQRLTKYASKIQPGLSMKDISKETFQPPKNLTTKLLEKLKGRTTVSKQFIEDLTNSPDLKQAERDMIRSVLKDEGGTVDVPTFANKVKTELLPLRRNAPKVGVSARDAGIENYRYENISLPSELRGPVANYSEHVYESPIKTSAGSVHFGNSYDGGNPGYFAHTRIEDLPGKPRGFPKDSEVDEVYGSPEGKYYDYKGDTRRIIEIQSDLFQKGRLENELQETIGDWRPDQLADELADMRARGEDKSHYYKELSDIQKNFDNKSLEVKKLEPYRNTWHERVIREEVKQAAKDGKTKLQFPTGETAMKIEGLGDSTRWYLSSGDIQLTPQNMKVGTAVNGERMGEGTGDWIITDVLGDGKFKAMPKSRIENMVEDAGLAYDSMPEKYWLDEITDKKSDLYRSAVKDMESFDISGKVDTENPIYKFYEKTVGKYLTNKYGAKRIKDAQGVEWYEMNVDKKQSKMPVEAFGALPLVPPLLGNKEE